MTNLRPTHRFLLTITTLIGLTMSELPLPAANYDETKVPKYELPDSLTMRDATRVNSAKDWMEKRRPEVLELFREQVYGRSPERPKGLKFKVIQNDATARCSSPSLARSKLPRPTCSFIFQKMLMARSRHF